MASRCSLPASARSCSRKLKTGAIEKWSGGGCEPKERRHLRVCSTLASLWAICATFLAAPMASQSKEPCTPLTPALPPGKWCVPRAASLNIVMATQPLCWTRNTFCCSEAAPRTAFSMTSTFLRLAHRVGCASAPAATAYQSPVLSIAPSCGDVIAWYLAWKMWNPTSLSLAANPAMVSL